MAPEDSPCVCAHHHGMRIHADSSRGVHCRDESGVFYALDMGGTNFRVVTVTLSKRANRVVSMLVLQPLMPFRLRSFRSTCNPAGIGGGRVPGVNAIKCMRQMHACRGMWT
jgi:Hexokinase